ncbi:hypothetical protein [uncultured Shewanella sp.]|uniref:hypothetical protein n=1 Tax=uncultured Shewanella sp. TaxID=173975 RepID=UPI0037048E43
MAQLSTCAVDEDIKLIASQIWQDAQKSPLLSRVIIYTMIAVSMLASAGYWGWSWYDDNTVVEVTITSPIEAMTNSYKVRKKDIEAQRITTVDGIQIRLSNQERLTIKTTNSPQ